MLCFAIEARFLRIISKRASSSGVTDIILRCAASERGWGSLADVRVLRMLYADEVGGACLAVCGRSFSSSRIMEGCRRWLDRLLLPQLPTLAKIGGENGSGVYIISMVAALVDVDIMLILRSKLRFDRTSNAWACPKTMSPASSSIIRLFRTANFRRARASSSCSSSEDENDRQLESCRLCFDKADSLVLVEFWVCNEI